MRTLISTLALLAFSFPVSSSDPNHSQLGDVAFLGVSHGAPRPQTIDANHLNAQQGVEIHRVFSDSSAERMGIREGDVILELNGVPIGNGLDLRTEIIRNIEGDPVSALIRRNGQDIELNGNFGSMGTNPARQALNLDADARYRADQERRLQQQQQALQELRDELKAIKNEIKTDEQTQQIEKEAMSDDPFVQQLKWVQRNGNWHLIYVIDSAAL